jgi:2'-5' RNA ligase
MRDHVLGGPGAHDDHSALRVANPTHHQHVDWDAKQTAGGDDFDKRVPEWWAGTEPLRKAVADDWDGSMATHFPRHEIPVFRSREKTASDGKADEFCVAFIVPNDVRTKIANWAATLEWPEGYEMDDPDDYHITVLYAPSGWREADHHDWVRSRVKVGVPAAVTGLDLFGPDNDTVVVRLEGDELSEWATKLMDEADERGLEVSRFPGGYKPHITIGKASKLPTGRDLQLKFRTGPLFLYHPRPLQTKKEAGQVVTARTPWHISPEGDTVEGQPGESLMQHLRGHYGLSTPDLWKMQLEVGKR